MAGCPHRTAGASGDFNMSLGGHQKRWTADGRMNPKEEII
jgi:hypothetical protein